MRIRLRRLVTAMTCALAVTLLALTTAVVTEVSAPTTAHASSIGGSISRNEILNRAKWWIDNYGVIYSQEQANAKPSVTGEEYRPDCSGFVSMAWRLPKDGGWDRSTRNLTSYGDTTTFSNLDNLQPGDAILGPGHVALFDRWTDSSKTSMYVYEEYSTGDEGRHAIHTKAHYENSDYNGVRYNEIVGSTGSASVYGALSDGRLTYTRLDTETGNRTHGAVTSTAKLGFTPKAMATLNFNTLLVTSTAGHLYRVDIITNDESLVFNTPVSLGSGWTHDLLTYDGSGHLFGIADGTLRRYNIGAAKPSASNITGNTLIDSGFALKTLASTGPDYLLGTTSAGELLSYKIDGAGDWSRYELRSSTWQYMDSLIAPGGGAFYGLRDGALHGYVDTLPYNGSGADLSSTGPVDTSGWTQTLLSAQPRTAA